MRMYKLTTETSYATSTGSTFYWLKQLLDVFYRNY
ncbi:phage holin [Providencia sp. PAZ2]